MFVISIFSVNAWESVQAAFRIRNADTLFVGREKRNSKPSKKRRFKFASLKHYFNMGIYLFRGGLQAVLKYD